MTTSTTIDPDGLTALRAAHPGTRVIDVRTPAEHGGGHVPGSVNIPLPDLVDHRADLAEPGGGPIVLVCQTGRRASTAADRLHAFGCRELHVLDGGVEAWAGAGHPTRTTGNGGGWTIERQVRGVAGAIVATSILASVRWPRARFVAGGIGGGLLFAALSDTCAMGNLLGRLPYNRRRGGAACNVPEAAS